MQEELLQWYEKNSRPLTFRQNREAYKIWVSEIMAQQTRIEAMLPYFERFIQAFPTITNLALADDELLHKVWQGLGYYNRCRNMKKCAQICMEHYDSQLPRTKEELMKLPGIGEYTAGAIASIAFGQKVSAVDGNVIRVFSRLYNIHEDVSKAKTKRMITKLVEDSLVDPIECYNQALMELGALICTPKNPRCTQCPIKDFCRADDPALLPIRPEKKKRKREKKEIYIWAFDHKLHIRKRKDFGLLANMYEFDESLPKTYIKKENIGAYTHIFSHVEWEMKATLVYCLEEGADFYSVETIDRSFAIPSAFLPFYQQVKKRLEKEENDVKK